MAGNNEEHEVRIPNSHTPHTITLRLTHGLPLQGASVQEILIEACRRNNVDLLTQIIDETGNDAKMASLLNDTRTVMGNHLYHEAASRGNCEHPPSPSLASLFLDRQTNT